MKNNKIFQCYTILLAAGKGSRLETGARIKKQFINYKGTPLWWQSIKKLYASPHIAGVVLVFPNDDEEFLIACEEAKKLHSQNNLGIPFIYVKGGDKRHDSVFAGLEALPASCTHVLVHDSARPFFSTRLIHDLVSPFKSSQYIDIHAIIPAIAVTDTIKVIQPANSFQKPNNTENEDISQKTGINQKIVSEPLICEQVSKTLERQLLRAVQTPQAFSVYELMEAHKKMQIQNNINNVNDIKNANNANNIKKIPQFLQVQEITDDAMLMEYAGHKVYVIQGEANNTKITHAEDLKLLQNPIQQIPCTGYGYDVHRFGGDRPFILGGISIPTPLQIEAHSDGDVLLHALMDALLSCMCLGDIGTHFPDTNPKYQNISSSLLLDHVMDLWKKSSLTLCHVDLTIITQKPHINPFAKEISKNVARLLSINPNFVNTKATTEEKLGFTGKGLGIKAVALVSALKTIEN